MRSISLLFIILYSFKLGANDETSINLVCPPDVWLNCGAEIWDLSAYGTAYYYVNGHAYSAGQPQVVYDLTTCETGKIYRTWQVEDYNWNLISCTQTIYISGGSFNYHNIHWPESDLQLYGCNISTHPDNLPYEYSRPHYDYMSCSMVGTSYKDQVFVFGPDCKKILRKWTVLDWCNYYPGNPNPGIWTYTQVIKVSKQEPPQLSCPQKIELLPNNCNGTYVNLQDVVADGQACSGSYVVVNDSPYADENGANASGFYPIGKTTVHYSVEYACGQHIYCSQEIVVKEKTPVPYCLSTLNVALMAVDDDGDGIPEDGMVELWAKDLDYASYHPCYPNETLSFSFSSSLDSSFVVFNCDHVGANEMQLWVTDSRGNQAWCAVTVNVQNNAANIPDCRPPDQNLRGIVKSISEEPLENVYIDVKSRAHYKTQILFDTVQTEVVIDSFITNGGLIVYMYDLQEELVPRQQTVLVPGEVFYLQTDAEGRFFSPELDPTRTYTINAFRFGDNSRIDESDIEALKAYLYESTDFENPYSYLAADINEDRQIDYTDLQILEEIYAGEEDEWPNERQWVFFDAAHFEGMESETNPLSLELSERIVLDQGVNRFKDKRFVGILKGDIGHYEAEVNGSGLVERRSISLKNQDMQPYPNPFVNQIYFPNPGNLECTVELFGMDGKRILSKRSSESTIEIMPQKNLGHHTYIYRITNTEGIFTGKLFCVTQMD